MAGQMLGTILVVEGNSASASRTVQALSEAGFDVIGPAQRASFAMALAAQAPADLALVAVDLNGSRSGFELADELLSTWGVPAVVVSTQQGDVDGAAGEARRVVRVPAGISARELLDFLRQARV